MAARARADHRRRRRFGLDHHRGVHGGSGHRQPCRRRALRARDPSAGPDPIRSHRTRCSGVRRPEHASLLQGALSRDAVSLRRPPESDDHPSAFPASAHAPDGHVVAVPRQGARATPSGRRDHDRHPLRRERDRRGVRRPRDPLDSAAIPRSDRKRADRNLRKRARRHRRAPAFPPGPRCRTARDCRSLDGHDGSRAAVQVVAHPLCGLRIRVALPRSRLVPDHRRGGEGRRVHVRHSAVSSISSGSPPEVSSPQKHSSGSGDRSRRS